MIAVVLHVPAAEQDHVAADLWEAGTAGITEDGERLTAFFDDDTTAGTLLTRFEEWKPVIEPQEEHDWVAETQAAWPPFEVGERFWLAPEWRDDPPPEGRLRLTIHPGMACGTGSGPATQLCLRGMEKWLRPGQTVLDVGTGSGILADAARLLGASIIVGCDIDHEASRIARGNVSGLAVFTGSARSVRSTSFDAVVANLNLAALSAIAPELLRARKADGILVLSGFRPAEAARLTSVLEVEPRETLTDSDWSCLVL